MAVGVSPLPSPVEEASSPLSFEPFFIGEVPFFPKKLSYADTLKQASSKAKASLSGEPETSCNGESKISLLSKGFLKLKPLSSHLGKRSVVFQKSDKSRLIARLKYVLIAKFSHGRPPIEVVHKFLLGSKIQGKYVLTIFDSKHIFIEFFVFEDFTRIWLKRSWVIQTYPVRFFKWTSDFLANRESPIVPVWVHLPHLPMYLFEEEALLSIANAIGKPLHIDKNNLNRTKIGYASFCVELDVSQPYLDELWIEFKDEGSSTKSDGLWQRIVYDVIPHFCVGCNHLGHNVEACKRKLVEFKSQIAVQSTEDLDKSNRGLENGAVLSGVEGGKSETSLDNSHSTDSVTTSFVNVEQKGHQEQNNLDLKIGMFDVGESHRKLEEEKVHNSGCDLPIPECLVVDRSCVPIETVHTRIRTDLEDQEMKFVLNEEVLIEDLTLEEGEIDVKVVGATAVKLDAAAVPVADYNEIPAGPVPESAADYVANAQAVQGPQAASDTGIISAQNIVGTVQDNDLENAEGMLDGADFTGLLDTDGESLRTGQNLIQLNYSDASVQNMVGTAQEHALENATGMLDGADFTGLLHIAGESLTTGQKLLQLDHTAGTDAENNIVVAHQDEQMQICEQVGKDVGADPWGDLINNEDVAVGTTVAGASVAGEQRPSETAAGQRGKLIQLSITPRKLSSAAAEFIPKSAVCARNETTPYHDKNEEAKGTTSLEVGVEDEHEWEEGLWKSLCKINKEKKRAKKEKKKEIKKKKEGKNFALNQTSTRDGFEPNRESFLTDEMCDIIPAFKTNSAPNSPSSRKCSFYSVDYSPASKAVLAKYGADTSPYYGCQWLD